jgi:hypothetical protein
VSAFVTFRTRGLERGIWVKWLRLIIAFLEVGARATRDE